MDQAALNTKLFEALSQKNLGEASSLLASGADINARHCEDGCRETPLMVAATRGEIAILEFLLDRGADATLLDSTKKTAFQFAQDSNKPEAATFLREYEDKKTPDRVVFYAQLGDRVRQDIYDFSQQERLTLIRQSRFGTVESAIITGFSAIEDQSDGSVLRKAFNEHMRRGGTTEEAAIFPQRLYKQARGLQKI